MKPFFPAYLNLESGDWESRISAAVSMLSECRMCPRECATNRLSGTAEQGRCATGFRARVVAYGPNLTEEAPLVGERGSGTVFFAGLALKYQFSQKYEMYKGEVGLELEPEQLAAIMLELQDQGCHNINLVSPAHVVAQIMAALRIAIKAGLSLPIAYNSDGYDALQTLRLLDGIVDIYIIDMRYGEPAVAEKYSQVLNYVLVNREGVREMHRQVGDLILDEGGLAKHGLIVRHMVLPRNLAGTEDLARYIAEEVSPDTYMNVMRRYRPSLGNTVPEINRPITNQEFAAALQWVKHAGLHRLEPEEGPRPMPELDLRGAT